MSYRRPVMYVDWPHGWRDFAEHVRARMVGGNGVTAWLAPDGRAFVRRDSERFRSAYTLPDSWLVGSFRQSTPQEVIEDSVIERMREISGQGREAA